MRAQATGIKTFFRLFRVECEMTAGETLRHTVKGTAKGGLYGKGKYLSRIIRHLLNSQKRGSVQFVECKELMKLRR
jgi:hypothetical protein